MPLNQIFFELVHQRNEIWYTEIHNRRMIDRQEQIAIGTVLGGSSLVRPPKGANFYLSMRSQQCNWLQWKMLELPRFFKNPTLHQYGKTYRCNSNCCHQLTNLYEHLYDENDKRIIREQTLESMCDIGWAVWFLDGGGKTGRGKKNAYLNVTKFGDEGAEIAKTYFDSLDVPCEIHKNGNRRRLLFTVRGTLRFLATVAGCFPEFMFCRL